MLLPKRMVLPPKLLAAELELMPVLLLVLLVFACGEKLKALAGEVSVENMLSCTRTLRWLRLAAQWCVEDGKKNSE